MVLGSGAAIFSAIILLQLLGSMSGYSHIVGYSLAGTALLSGGFLVLFKGLQLCKGPNKVLKETPVTPTSSPTVRTDPPAFVYQSEEEPVSHQMKASEISIVSEESSKEEYLDKFILINLANLGCVRIINDYMQTFKFYKVNIFINIQEYLSNRESTEWSKLSTVLKNRMQQFREKYGPGCIFTLHIISSLDEREPTSIQLAQGTTYQTTQDPLIKQLSQLFSEVDFHSGVQFSQCFDLNNLSKTTMTAIGGDKEVSQTRLNALINSLPGTWDCQKVAERLSEESKPLFSQAIEYKKRGGEFGRSTFLCVPFRTYLL
jgi:hypothetical protein